MNSSGYIKCLAIASLCCGSIRAKEPDVSAPLLPGEPSAAEILRAREIIHRWETDDSEKGERLLRIVYWTPVDREPQPEYRQRLTRVMKHIQEFYNEQLASYGFSGRTIRLEFEKDGMIRLPLSKGSLKSAECNEQDQSVGQKIRKDCLETLKQSGIDGNKETMVIFCNLADWDPQKRVMGHHSPYYASGKSTSGTAWQVDSPLLDSGLLAVKDQTLTDRQYGRISVGKYNSIFVGGVCHELGHALGLPHCRECGRAREIRGTALMGSGNRTYGENLRGESKGSFLSLPHALKLATHPQFSGSVKQLLTPAKVEFRELQMTSGPQGLEITGKLTANPPCYTVIAYGDPEGNGDYDSAIAAGIPLPDGTFTLTLPPAETKSKAALLSLVGVCVNGAATASVWSSQALSLPCRIDDQGLYDAAPAIASFEIASHTATARAGGLHQEKLAALSPTARECLRRLTLPDQSKGKPSPAAAPDSMKSMTLSDAAPETAATGYGGVHFDRTNSGLPLIGPDGPAAHGLWAHANSCFIYKLGGKWSTLTGRCALLQSGNGPITTTILVDGKPVWKSGVIKQGVVKPFSIPLAGATTLTLVMEGTAGISNTHGAWLEPLLSR